MSTDALPESWEILRQWLPSDLNASAREHGFLLRARGLQDAERWLRLLLMHVGGGLSLEQTVMRAGELGLAQISAVALSLRLPELSCDHFEITDDHGGEKLGRFRFVAGEWILADRGYSHRAGVALVLQAKAHLILRWNPAVLPVEEKSGQPF